MSNTIKNLLESETEQLDRLKNIVQQTIKEEELMVENLLHPPKETLTKGQSISDKVANFGGSWYFIISFSIILMFWIIANTFLPLNNRFDPFPFILMNLVLSAIAALQAPIIMMSQNRKEEKDRKRNENDYLINLKTELEMRSLHKKIDLLLEEEIKVLYATQAKQLEILYRLETKLDAKEKS